MATCEGKSGSTMPRFRPFTQESLAAMNARIADKATQKIEQDGLKAEDAIELDSMQEHYSLTHHDKMLEPDPALEAGMRLPRSLARNFPPELIATPIEDLDKYYEKNRTFMLINKRKDIFRFSTTNSMFILSPFNPLRRIAIKIIVHPVFSFLIMAAIFINCMFMTLPMNESIERAELIFISIYTIESCIKVIAMGFILEKFTYLRDPWNWLDFILNILAYVTIVVDLGLLSVFRVFRILRALKISVSGLKITVGALVQSVKNLKEVIILTLFSLTIFALLGMQLYMGVLTQKCVRNPDPNLNMSWDDYVSNYSNTEENWLQGYDGYILCGNLPGTRHCPTDSTCVQGVGPNPDYGYTTFDSFPWALLSAFRLMTKDFWESLYQMVLKTTGTWHICYFVVILFWCSFYLVYLILAVVAKSYEEFYNKACKKDEEEVALQADADAAVSQALANQPVSPVSDEGLPKKQSDVTVVDMKDIIVMSDLVDEAGGGQSKENGGERDEKLKPQKNSAKEGCSGKCSRCTDIFCVWDCCVCWVRFQEILSLIIFDPFMELFITLCVIANVLFMAMDHHDMEESFDRFLRDGNYFFTAVYVIEAFVKMICLSPKFYFRDGWNKFDFFIAVSSLLELILEGVQGLSILRAFRLLRVFKLAKPWPMFELMLSVLCKKSGHGLGNLTFVLGIIIFLYSVIGMELFGKNYEEKRHLFYNEEIPYWNFRDFFHSYMVVFRALCGEWIETMWDCLLVGGWTCIPFFISFVAIGNLLMLNLFFALLLSTARVFNLRRSRSTTAEPTKLQEAFNRFSRAGQWLKNSLLKVLKVKRSSFEISQSVGGRNGTSSSLPLCERGTVTNQIADQTSEMMRKDLPEGQTTEVIEDVILPDICPACCCAPFPCCKENTSAFWVRWNAFRKKSFYMIEHIYFERLVFTVILISSLALAAEDVSLKDRPLLKEILHYMEKIFTVFFLFEMLLYWLVFGCKTYFKNAWNWLAFAIVLVFVFNQTAELLGYAIIPAFRTLRALLPLRLTLQVKGIRMVVRDLVGVIPAIFNFFLVCHMIWLVFAIMGVQMMGGQFYSCVDSDGNRLNTSFVPDRMACEVNNFTWIGSKIKFDSVLNAYLALFEVVTVKGWIDIMHNSIDATGIDQQPEEESNVYMYLYFVFFLIFGFFLLSLFIGVFIDNWNQQKRKEGTSLEMLMTEDQISYRVMKKMRSKKPVKAIPRPKSKLQAMVFDLIINKKFDLIIMIFIFLNMIVIAMEHYNPTPLYDTILESLNRFFIAIFTAECVLKLFALRKYYFKKPWNVFDFVIVILSILEILIKDLIAKYYFVSPTLLRAICVVKIGRVLRLLKFLLLSKGISTLFLVLSMSLRDIINICLLHCLVMFSYAIFGMFLFMNVRHRAGIDENFNFETFGQSILLLIQISTTAGWDSVLAGIMEEYDCIIGEDGDCGSRSTAVAYLVSYLIINFLIIIMYIAVILKNFSQATEDMKEGLTDDDYDKYYEIWQKFDPDGTQYIRYSDLAMFLESLEEPLQLPKPNKYKIISMDIPICEGDLVFCVDILDALTKDFLRRKGHHIDELSELEAIPRETESYNPVSSTLIRQREDYAASVMQSAWKRYKGNEK